MYSFKQIQGLVSKFYPLYNLIFHPLEVKVGTNNSYFHKYEIKL